jgi:hypothetical protein
MIPAQPFSFLFALTGYVFAAQAVNGRPVPLVRRSNATISSQDKILNFASELPIPIVNEPLTTQISAKGSNESSSGAVISSAFAYNSNSSLYPGVRVPPAWSFSIGLLHPFIYPEEVDQNRIIYHSASLDDGSDLPGWLNFDNTTTTFWGLTPDEVDGGSLYRIQLMASNTFGQVDVHQGFNLTVASHSLEAIKKDLGPTVNLTTGYPISSVVTSAFGLQLDGISLGADEIKDLQLETEALPWLSWNASARSVHGTPPVELTGTQTRVPVMITDTFGDHVQTDLTLHFEAYAFTSNETSPFAMSTYNLTHGNMEENEVIIDLKDYAASAMNDLVFEFTTIPAEAQEWLSLITEEGELQLRGFMPTETEYSSIECTLKAINYDTQAVSLLSFHLETMEPEITDPEKRSHKGFTSAQLAGIVVAATLAGIALILLLIFLLFRPKKVPAPAIGDLEIRKSALFSPEPGLFSRIQRKGDGLDPEDFDEQTWSDKDSDSRSNRTMIEKPEIKSSSSMLSSISRNALRLRGEIEDTISRAGRSRPVREAPSNAASSLPPICPIDDQESPKTPGPFDRSQLPSSVLMSTPKNSFFDAARNIARRGSTDSSVTAFTNFSGDPELWGRSEHEDESNFSQTPSQGQRRRSIGAPGSADWLHATPNADRRSSPMRAASNDSPSPTPNPNIVTPRMLHTINEDSGKEVQSQVSSLNNPFSHTSSEMTSIGSIHHADRLIINSEPDVVVKRDVRRSTYGTEAGVTEPGIEAHMSLAAMIAADGSWSSTESPDATCTGSFDKGSIIKETSYEGLRTRDSVVADAEEFIDGSTAQQTTSIAEEARRIHEQVFDVTKNHRKMSSRRTGSCSFSAI